MKILVFDLGVTTGLVAVHKSDSTLSLLMAKEISFDNLQYELSQLQVVFSDIDRVVVESPASLPSGVLQKKLQSARDLMIRYFPGYYGVLPGTWKPDRRVKKFRIPIVTNSPHIRDAWSIAIWYLIHIAGLK